VEHRFPKVVMNDSLLIEIEESFRFPSLKVIGDKKMNVVFLIVSRFAFVGFL
jgi:hypothetical protein